MNKEVSFELAKLLKEKGFDNYTPLKYFSKKPSGYNIINWSENIPYNCEDIYSQLSLGYNKQTYFTWAPTIAEVVMWLYEKHEIWIDVSLNQFSKPKDLQWMYSIVFTEDCTYSHSPKSYTSPTEAYEAAIEYTLNNLI